MRMHRTSARRRWGVVLSLWLRMYCPVFKDAGQLATAISDRRDLLMDKDCIIVGSPDVSDFAEIVLARVHQIPPYGTNERSRRVTC